MTKGSFHEHEAAKRLSCVWPGLCLPSLGGICFSRHWSQTPSASSRAKLCPPPNSCVTALTPSVTVSGDKALKGNIKVKRDPKGGCPYKKRHMPTEDKAPWGHTEKAAVHKPRKRNQPHQHLEPGLLAVGFCATAAHADDPSSFWSADGEWPQTDRPSTSWGFFLM